MCYNFTVGLGRIVEDWWGPREDRGGSWKTGGGYVLEFGSSLKDVNFRGFFELVTSLVAILLYKT